MKSRERRAMRPLDRLYSMYLKSSDDFGQIIVGKAKRTNN